ncbi:hypothetical protein J7382_01485 [Shimia sp. R11_0]|uniref:COG4223 family protein n=1 Tax=Shimia sp. R11_0 TaxID=2821096 RepID=UPI001ADB0C49|nr:hypothetical protein [Shimia sp. R11_0]
MGTTDKSDKPSEDLKDQPDVQAAELTEEADQVEDAEILEDIAAEAEDPDLEGAEPTAEDPLEIAEPAEDALSVETDEAPEDATDAPESDSVPEAEVATELEVSAPSTEAPVTPAPRKGGFVPLVLGGVVAAAIGFGGAVYFGDQLGLGADTKAAMAEMSETLKALEAAQAAQVEAAETARSEGAQQGAALTGLGAEISAMSEAVAALEARLTAIEARPLDEGASAAALAAYGREVAALRELVAEQADTAAALKEKADHSAQVALARTAVTRIVAALDSGAPYRAAIVDLTSVTGGSVAPVLDSHADEGIVTLAALIESYPDAARAALAQARADKVDAGTGNKLGNFLKTQFGARSVEAREGSDTDAILSRAEAALKAGDLDAALAELDTLAEGPKSVMSEWAAQAQTRRDVAQAAEDLAQTLNNN